MIGGVSDVNVIDLVVGLLEDALAVPICTDIPRDRPPRMVLVSLDGDASSEFLLKPRVALTCWGTSDRDAHEGALSAVQALQDAALDHPYLSGVDLETMSRDEWSRTGQGRYLAILNLTINVDD